MSHFGSSGKGNFDQRCAGLTPAAARLRDSRLGGSSARAPFPRAADARPGRGERPKPVLLPAPLDVFLLKHRSVAGGSNIWEKNTRSRPTGLAIRLRRCCLRKRVLSAGAGSKRSRRAQFYLEFRDPSLTLFPGCQRPALFPLGDFD